MILIKIVEKNYIEFKEQYDNDTLKLDNSELWGSTPTQSKQIFLGGVIKANKLVRISVKRLI